MSPISFSLCFLKRSTLLICMMSFVSVTAFAHGDNSHDETAEDNAQIVLKDGYARATFPMAKTAAMYFTLHNMSENEVRFVSVSVDEEVADEAQIHTTEMQGDVMRMRHVDKGVSVAANGHIAFAPGGYHIMLMGLKNGLQAGSGVKLTLSFDSLEDLHVVLPVKEENKGMQHHGHH